MFRISSFGFRIFLISAAVLSSAFSKEPAEDSIRFVFPPDAGMVDVTQPPYNARPGDMGDDTAAIQKALDDHPNGNRIIYLPDGEYVVSDTLRWPHGNRGGVEEKRTILQGQSSAKTILKLKDGAPGFTDPENPKAVIWTGKKPAQRFRNGIRTLTVDTGRGNAGAIGVQYIANNQGSMRGVVIRSGDGAGVIGLDLGYTDEQGPCLIKDVLVDGFDVGVSCKSVVDSIVIEGLTLRNQKSIGLSNSGQCVSIRHLWSTNAVPAILNKDINGLITLIDSHLAGSGRAAANAAIENNGALLVRDTAVEGYRAAVENTAKAGTGQNAPAGKIDLYVSHQPLTTAGRVETARTLRLPIKETPAAPQPPLAEWAGPHQFGGKPGEDATEAVQKAIDSGATVIYFPAGKGAWKIDGEVLVRGNVARVTALEGGLAGTGTFKIVEGTPDTVFFDRADLLYQKLGLENASDRTMVVSGVTFGKGPLAMTGKGDLFLEDVCSGQFECRGINVWARQINPEGRETKVINDGGKLWVLGLKTENEGTVSLTSNGGQTEILGGFVYAQGQPKTTPMFVVEDGSLSASVGETTWNGRNFKTILKVTRGGKTESLEYSPETIYWRNNKAAMLPLLMALPK